MGYRIKHAKAWFGGVIPYTFQANVPEDVVQLIKACMNRWEQYVNEGKNYIQFIERTTEPRYLLILRDDVGSTGSGEIGRPTEREFSRFCLNLKRKGDHPEDEKSIPHELGHVLGLAHEHQRSRIADEADAHNPAAARLYYLGHERPFQKLDAAQDKARMHQTWDNTYVPVGAYDLQSIMHYPDAPDWRWNYEHFQDDPDNAIPYLNYPSLEAVRAGRWEPSPGDVATLRDLYTPPPNP
jgi:Astacin (Peptidase family M12A)